MLRDASVNPRDLVRPLEPRWQDVLDAVLSRSRLSTRDVARLAPKVQELSRAYNMASAEGVRTKLPIEARLAFSFPRDVPKGAGAARELVASGALAMPEGRALRVLDLGAGLGAMTWGLVRALSFAGATGRVEACFVDEDEEALRHAVEIARAVRSLVDERPVELAITTRVESIAAHVERFSGPPADVAILGQVLSELDPREAPEVRVQRHAALVARVLERAVTPGGSVIVVEPALRDRTRNLHAVRDRLLDRSWPHAPVTVFAPCLHAARCPAFALEGEWCHEDLPVDLPPWVQPLARAAGLRWQGLTFSYLVLRKDGRGVVEPLDRDDPRRVRFRVVSELLWSKGKVELFTCGEDGRRMRLRRLDRDAKTGRGVPFEDLHRGDIVTLSSTAGEGDAPQASPAKAGGEEEAASERPVDERGRVKAGTHVAIDVGKGAK